MSLGKMNEYFVYIILIIGQLYIYLADADLTECSYNNREGICITESDCYGRSVASFECNCCLNPNIVREKCDEYRNIVYENMRNSYQHYIIGGHETRPREFSHMVAVGTLSPGQIQWICGGTIISPNFVLTAAHCCLSKGSEHACAIIRAGSNDLTDTNGIEILVDKVIVHPNYDEKMWTIPDDIALLHVSEPFQFSNRVMPACLLNEQNLNNIKSVTITGWGIIDEVNKTPGSSILQKAELDLMRIDECKEYYPVMASDGFFRSSLICAGDKNDLKGACRGDSGGPLGVQINDSLPYYGIIGIVSSSSQKCHYPGFYTRVPYYLTWIVKYVWPEGLEYDKLIPEE